MTGELISACDPRWTGLLATTRHDIYQTPEYGAFCGRHEDALPVAFFARDESTSLLIPLLVRSLPPSLGADQNLRDLISPYGYAGILLNEGTRKGCISQCLHEFVVYARRAGFVSAFIRLHPLITVPDPPATQDWCLVKHGQTVYIDLTRSAEEIWADTRVNHRRQIRKLVDLGFQPLVNRWDLLPDFVSMYRKRMIDRNADTYYLFSEDYFRDLRNSFGERLLFCTVLTRCGELACAGLFTLCGDIIQYHLGAYSPSFVVAPSKMMFHFVTLWGKSRGYRVLHLGGGVGARADDLFRYKAGFSSLRADFHTLRVVCDQRRYAEFVARRCEGSCSPGSPAFFPAYRDSVMTNAVKQ